MKYLKTKQELKLITENVDLKRYDIPSYDECVEICAREDAVFYESKMVVEGFSISVFNYRFATYSDFVNPLLNKPNVGGKEMRGLCFVFNKDGSLFKRYLLLEKFFNLNQVPDSMYSIVKDYKIKFINNKEDGSIASFIRLPNGKVVGKSKMGFDNEQSNGINRIYRTNSYIKKLVDWSLDNDIVSIFEYVAPHNMIVLRYTKEELILLRFRDNETGAHIDIKEHLDKVGSIKVAPFEDDDTLDGLIEKSLSEIDREGWVVQFHNGHMVKIKTAWYCALHGLLTNDLYREHILIEYILEDKIDDILGQIPEEQVEARERINKMISIIKQAAADKVVDIQKSYQVFVGMGENRKNYALQYRKHSNFGYVMAMAKGGDIYELAKDWIRTKTDKLMIAREWLREKDPTLFFQDPEEDEDAN